MWETIDKFSERLKVPGGWIVRTSYLHVVKNAGVAVACHQIFIADPSHEWSLELTH